ncbi:MAG: signal peptidase II [Clostridia bacterium]|jgi:signal peptidase II|nr:signal peptidase II [Clostridia bacterium]MDD4665042.1 signal peptidase II [Clostridia bacterium]
MVFWLGGALVLFFDRWTKFLIVEGLALGQTYPVIEGFLHFTYIRNPGAAFGLFAEKTWFFLMITVFILFVIIYLQYTWGKENIWLSLGLGLIAGGAVGNFIDRLQTGLVIDFIDFRGIWPYVFNIADAAIVIGMILLAWQILVSENVSRGRGC